MKTSFIFGLICLTLPGLLQAQIELGGLTSSIVDHFDFGESVSGQSILDELAEAEPVEGPKTHTVQSGDNPWTIAREYGVSTEELLALNEITNTKNLQIGQVLKLPKVTPAAHKPIGIATPDSLADTGNFEVYTIKKGDNPWTIAKRLKIDPEDLLSLNPDLDPRDLKIGQTLKLPPPKKPSTSASATSAELTRQEPAFEADGHDVYTIKKGDNPWTVARRLKIDYQALIDLNQIADARDLKIGQKLKLPRKGEVVTPQAGETIASEPAFDPDGHEIYVIKRGDNPWTLAQKLNIDSKALIDLNGIDNPNDLKIGRKLKLPKKE